MRRKITRTQLAWCLAAIASWTLIPVVLAQQERERKRSEPSLFVCYTNGSVTQKQSGVSSAEEKVSGPAWRIVYVDGGYAIYAQREGELCQVETTK